MKPAFTNTSMWPKKISLLLPLLLASMLALGQYEKKITVRLQSGSLYPMGGKLKPDLTPFLYSNFAFGANSFVSIQYNTQGRMSYGIMAGPSFFFSFSTPESYQVFSENAFNSFDLTSLGVYAKMKVFKKARLNPYVALGTQASYYWGQIGETNNVINNYFPLTPDQTSSFVSIERVVITTPSQNIQDNAAWGFNSAIGAEFDISQTIGLFLEGLYVFHYTAFRADLQQNLNSLGVNIGFTFNFFRAKTR